MNDITMSWTGDLSASSTGDLQISSGVDLGTERILRRLMTNPGDYLWNPQYGAGLGQFVGRPIDAGALEALVRSQMALESVVSASPEPTVSTQVGVNGQASVQIRYADADTATAATVAIELPG